MRQPLVLLAVIVALVAGLYFFLVAEPDRSPQGAISTQRLTAGANPSTGSRDSAISAPDVLVEPPARKEVGQEAAELTTDENERPQVFGRVVDGNGVAVPLAEVIIGRRDLYPLRESRTDAKGGPWRWTCVTDADGRFAVAPLMGSTLRMGIWSAGHEPLIVDKFKTTAKLDLDLGDLVLQPGVILEGHVIDANGNPVGGAQLALEGPNFRKEARDRFRGREQPPVAVSEANGAFRIACLAAGPWRLRVDSSAHPTGHFEGQANRPGQVVDGLRFQLARATSISGQLLGAPNMDLGEVTVCASSGSGRRSAMAGGTWRDCSVQANGEFLIEGCEEGVQYEVFAFRKRSTKGLGLAGDVLPLTEVVAAKGGDSNLVLEWVGRTGVRFRVVDQGGQALENFKVSHGRRIMRNFRPEGAPSGFFEGGQVLIPDAAMGDDYGLGGSFKIQVEAAGFSSLSQGVDLIKGQLVDLGDLRLEPVGILNLVVTDARDGKPVRGARIALQIPKPTPRGLFDLGIAPNHRGVTDKQGIGQVSLFPGALGALEVTHYSFADYVLEDLSMPFNGDIDLEIKLLQGGRVDVTAQDVSGQALVEATIEITPHDTGGMPLSASTKTSDAAGLVTFEHLQPGEYKFRILDFPGQANQQELTSKPSDDQWPSVFVVEGGLHSVLLKDMQRATMGGLLRQDGMPLVDAKLTLVEGDLGSPVAFSQAKFGPNRVNSDDQGHYMLEGLKPGTYGVLIQHATRAMGYIESVELVAGVNAFDFDLPGARVAGRVMDADGQPLAGAQVSVMAFKIGGRMPLFHLKYTTSATKSNDSQMAGSMQTDDQGQFELRGVLSGYDLQVSASLAGLAPAQSAVFQVTDRETKTGLELVLRSAGSVQVSVKGFEDALVILAKGKFMGSTAGVGPVSVPVRNGAAVLDGLRPGTWEITLSAIGGGSAFTVPSQAVEVLAGQMVELEFQD